MTAIWPTTLPQAPEPRGYSNKARDNVYHKAMSYGQGKKRPKAIFAIRDVNMQFFLGNTEADILDDFYTTTLNRVEPFTWIDHRNGDEVKYRFLAPPTVVPFGTALYWDVTLQLEITEWISAAEVVINALVDTLDTELGLVETTTGETIIETPSATTYYEFSLTGGALLWNNGMASQERFRSVYRTGRYGNKQRYS